MTRPEEMRLTKIISGGQTGVDRAALDAALERGFPCGGSCPESRAAEDGTIPARYPLTPLAGAGFSERTLQNVLDGDGTVIFSHGATSGGTRLTLEVCQRQQKTFLVIDAARTSPENAVVTLIVSCTSIRFVFSTLPGRVPASGPKDTHSHGP
jgi:hypothetical protein